MQNIELGDLVKDRITGMEGVIVCDTMWLNGCRRITIQPTELKDGKPIDSITFDEDQLVLVTSNAVPSKGRALMQPSALERTGGTGPEPSRHAGPTR